MNGAEHGADDVPRCSACGYDLRGIQGNTCPECGADVEEARRTVAGIDVMMRGLLIEIVLDVWIAIFGALVVAATRRFASAIFFIAAIVGIFGLGVWWVNGVTARYGLVFRERKRVWVYLVPALIGALSTGVILLPILL